MNNTSKNLMVLLWCIFLIALIIVVPMISIWSVNTIFGTNIAYTISTWFAAFWLSAVTIAPKFKTK